MLTILLRKIHTLASVPGNLNEVTFEMSDRRNGLAVYIGNRSGRGLFVLGLCIAGIFLFSPFRVLVVLWRGFLLGYIMVLRLCYCFVPYL